MTMMTPEPATFQLPAQMSTAAEVTDRMYYLIYWMSVAFFVVIVGLMVYWSYKYRRRPGHKAEPTGHALALEIGWTVAPLFVIAGLFHWGFKGFMHLAVAPADAMEVRVNAKQWGWEFVYPGGETDNELHVPVGKPVKLILTSADVLHAFYSPGLRVKRDAVPGMFTTLWFQGTTVGKDDIFCAEYCGGKSRDASGNELPFDKMTGHWSMHSWVHIETQENYDKYIRKMGDKCPPAPQPCAETTLVEWGKELHVKKACVSCHTVDGTKTVGPTWKGLYGKKEDTSAGPVTVDENYLRESILDPNAKVVTGFSPSMPTYKGQIKDREIDAIISYMKSIK